jgi:hypothetical protein
MKLGVAGTATTLAVLIALALPSPAHARGFGGRSFGFARIFYANYFRFNWWRNGYWRYGRAAYYGSQYGSGYVPSYGGYGGDVSGTGGWGYPIATPVQFITARSAPTCQPSVEVVTVPSEEDGGDRQITVRRCMQ